MDIRERLNEGNRRYVSSSDAAIRRETAENGQHPYAAVVCCSDSRVVPERIFDAGIGELFVIRVAGSVLDRHQIGSIEYAAGHLGCRTVVVLGHTGCGAVGAALAGGGHGYVRFITDEILKAVGTEKDPDRACRKNAAYAVRLLKEAFAGHPEAGNTAIEGAVYDIRTGEVTWLDPAEDTGT